MIHFYNIAEGEGIGLSTGYDPKRDAMLTPEVISPDTPVVDVGKKRKYSPVQAGMGTALLSAVIITGIGLYQKEPIKKLATVVATAAVVGGVIVTIAAMGIEAMEKRQLKA